MVAVAPALTVMDPGLTATETGGAAVMVTVAEADLVASAAEVAVTVTVPPVGGVAGAVNVVGLEVVLLNDPQLPEGAQLQVTAVLAFPVTTAVN